MILPVLLLWEQIIDADTSKFAKKSDLAHLKSDIDELDIGRLKYSADLRSNLSNTTEKEVVQKTASDKLLLKADRNWWNWKENDWPW